MIHPKIAQFSDEHRDVVFLAVDVDEVAGVAEKLGVTAMPTFKFIKYANC